MPDQTAEEIALARKYELLRKKRVTGTGHHHPCLIRPTHASACLCNPDPFIAQEQQAAKQREQKQVEQQDAQKKPAGPTAKLTIPTTDAQKSTTAAPEVAKKAEAEPSKPLSPHEKALQALRAAKGSAGARTGIGQVSRKRPMPAAGEADSKKAGQLGQEPEVGGADTNRASTAAAATKCVAGSWVGVVGGWRVPA